LQACRPKTAKLVSNTRLRDYVQDRLGGLIARPDGTAVSGPQVRWIGRRHGPRARSAMGNGVEPRTDRSPVGSGVLR
jgi:hypothetical protein